jgi:hypothetical protein
MARNRASMREGPLADLFRATEAAQRQAKEQEAAERRQQELPVDPPVQKVEEPPPANVAPIRAVAPAPAPDSDPEPASERRERALAR